jgi:amino acid transporter
VVCPLLLSPCYFLFTAIGAIAHRRLVVSVVLSIALAALLSYAITAFTAGYSLSLVILGIAFGVYWQARAEAGLSLTAKVEEPKISRPVAFLGLMFIGVVCGGFLYALLHSALFGAAGLVCGVVAVEALYRFARRDPIPLESLAFSALSLLTGYSLLLVLISANTP